MSAAVACGLVVAAACGNPPARSSIPAPDDWPGPAESIAPADPTDLLIEPQTTVAPQTSVEPQTTGTESASAVAGLIAATGPRGLRVTRPDGEVVAEIASDQIVTQPTWSRDGRFLAATLIDPATGAYQVAVIDTGSGEVAVRDARRPYFFYTWSHDGSRLAALGPGSSSGTAVDILDGTGTSSAANSLQGASMYVAWEPGGRRLLLHAGPQLLLISDPDTPGEFVDLGVVGSDFQAPAWVPGTSDFLYVDSISQDLNGRPRQESDVPVVARLMRRNTESGEITSLGPVGGFTEIAVHPEGDRAALSLPPSSQLALPERSEGLETVAFSSTDDPADNGGVGAGASESSGSIEIVDLATAERIKVLDRQGAWLEWSPGGDRLLIAARVLATDGGPGLAWYVWDGEKTQEWARFTPSPAFAQRYLPFAGQYTETPRLWSPDGAAITFGALIDGEAASAVVRLDDMGRLARLGTADVSFWSPAAASSAAPSEPQPDQT